MFRSHEVAKTGLAYVPPGPVHAERRTAVRVVVDQHHGIEAGLFESQCLTTRTGADLEVRIPLSHGFLSLGRFEARRSV